MEEERIINSFDEYQALDKSQKDFFHFSILTRLSCNIEKYVKSTNNKFRRVYIYIAIVAILPFAMFIPEAKALLSKLLGLLI
jgi:hypothetical protein